MDLYGINSAISEGNSRTQSNDLYNENLRTARDTINNQISGELVKAKTAATSAAQTQSQDKLLYGVHDAIDGMNLYSSFSKFGQSSKAFAAEAAKNPGQGFTKNFFKSQATIARKENPYTKVFLGAGSTPASDKVASVVTDTAADVAKRPPIASGRVPPMPASAAPPTSRVVAAPGPRPPEATPAVAGQPQTVVQQRVSELEERQRQASVAPRTDTTPAASRANTPAATKTPTTTATIESTPTGPKTPPEDSFDKTKAVVGDVGEKVGRGLRFAGDAAGVVSTYNLFKNWDDIKKEGGAKEVSAVAGAVGTGLDIVGAFIPALEPLGELANAVSSIADTVDTYKTDKAATTAANNEVDDLPTRGAKQVAALGAPKGGSVPVNAMATSGLIASQSQHVQNATRGSGSF